MKASRYSRVLISIRNVFYLTILVALAWYIIASSAARDAIGGFGLALLWIFIIFATLIIIVRWPQQKAPIIYPFLNATGDGENNEKYNALATNFSELLQIEIQRITHLLYIPESISANNPASTRDKVPRPIVTSTSAASLESARIEGELAEILKGIGAFTLGNVSLPLGRLLYLIVHFFQGGGITGKIQKFGEILSVVATYGNRKYESSSAALPLGNRSENTIAKRLARQLAYMMSSDFADFPPSRWQAFKEVIDGLEEYRRYLLSGRQNLSALNSAYEHFEKATVEDGLYAWAYYNLGLLYEEKGLPDSAFEMYYQAVQMEPNLREAQFKLGQAYFQKGQYINAINAGRRAIELAKFTRRTFPVARTSLGKWIVKYSREFLQNRDYTDAHKYCDQAAEQLHMAGKEYNRLIRQERNRIEFSEQRLANLKTSAVSALKELSRAYQLMVDILEEENMDAGMTEGWRIWSKRLGKIFTQLRIKRNRRKAELALLECLKIYPESSTEHAELGVFYMGQKKYELAKKYLESAGNISPDDKSVVLDLGATYLTPAFDILMDILDENPDEPLDKQNWSDQRINAIQSQLTYAIIHYQKVVDLIRERGEAGFRERDSMIEALNGLATAYGGQAVIDNFQQMDFSPLILRAKEYLGKALVLDPFSNVVYDNLAGLYEAEFQIMNLMKSDPPSDGAVVENGAADLPADLEVQISQKKQGVQAYDLLNKYVTEYQEPDTIAGIVTALAISTPEQRASFELVDKFLKTGSLDLLSIDKIQPSTDAQIYLWAAGWMFISVKLPTLGIGYLERSLTMGDFPEADLVNYDLACEYRNLGEYGNAAALFQKVYSDDPYYWQSEIFLADTLRDIEDSELNTAAVNTFIDENPSVAPTSVVDDEQQVKQAPLDETAPEAEQHPSHATALSPPTATDDELLPPSDQEKYTLPTENITAEQLYTDAIALSGNDPYRRATALAARADLHLFKREYDLAIQDCLAALGLVPVYAYPHRLLASIYMDLFDYDRSIEHWKRVGELLQESDEPQYHLALGYTYIKKAISTSDSAKATELRWQAVTEYQHANRLFMASETRDMINTQIALGDTLMALKQYKEAEIPYLSALKLSQGMLEEITLHIKLALVYVKLDLYGLVRQEYQQAIEQGERQLKLVREQNNKQGVQKLNGYIASACNLMAYYVYAERNINLKDGLGLVNRALATLEDSGLDREVMEDTRGAYLDTRGWLYYRQGEYESARRDLETALSLTMGTVYEHGHLALVYDKLAELSSDKKERESLNHKAQEQWEFAFELDHDGLWSKYKQSV